MKNVQKRPLTVILVLLALLTLSHQASAAYYFSTSGSTVLLALTSCTEQTPCALSILQTLLALLTDTSPTFVLLDINTSVNLSSAVASGSNLTVQFSAASLASATASLINLTAKGTLNIVVTGASSTTASKSISFTAPNVVLSSLSASGLSLSLSTSSSYAISISDTTLSALTFSSNPTTIAVSNVTTSSLSWSATTMNLVGLYSSAASPSLTATTLTLSNSNFTASSTLDASLSAVSVSLTSVAFKSARAISIAATGTFNWVSSSVKSVASTTSAFVVTTPSATLQAITFDGTALSISGSSASLINVNFTDSAASSSLSLADQSTATLTSIVLNGGKLITRTVSSLAISSSTFIASDSVALDIAGSSASNLFIITGSSIEGSVNVTSASLSLIGTTVTGTSGSAGKKFNVQGATASLSGSALTKLNATLSVDALSISNCQFTGDSDDGKLMSLIAPALNSVLYINGSSTFTSMLLSAESTLAINIASSSFSKSALSLASRDKISITASSIAGTVSAAVSVLDLSAPSVDFSGSSLTASLASGYSDLATVSLAATGTAVDMTFLGSLSVPRLELSNLSSLSIDGSLVISTGLAFVDPIAAQVSLDVSGALTLPVSNSTVSSVATHINISTPHVILALSSLNEQLNAQVSLSIDADNMTTTFDSSVQLLNGTLINLGTDIVVRLPNLVDIDPLLSLIAKIVDRVLLIEVGGVTCSPTCQNGGTCIGLDICSCTTGWGGVGCACSTANLPSFVTCGATQLLSWVINSSVTLEQSLVLPSGVGLVVQGDLALAAGGSLELSSTSTVEVQGSLSNSGGSIVIQPYTTASTSSLSPSGGSKRADVPTAAPESTPSASNCTFNISSYITTQHLNLSSSSNITVVINMTSLIEYYGSDSGVECLATNAIINVTDSSAIDGYINVIIIGSDSQTRAQAEVISSGDTSSSSIGTGMTLKSSTSSSSSCSSITGSSGIVSVFVNPCSGTNPDGTANPNGRALKWYYYGIPIIAVAVIAVIVAIVILSVPKFRNSVAPYRGTRI